jgi:arylsulfatase A-like enzyme
VWVLAVWLLVLALTACTRDAPPNVLLVTLDTTRADRLGPYGFDGGTTPSLDAFAREAVVFERAYAASSWTLPSHASLFTGLLPMQHGAQTAPHGQTRTLGYAVRPLDDAFLTLAERLSSAGYRTAAVIGGPALKRELGLAQGFDFYEDDLGNASRGYQGRRAADTADRAIARIRAFGAAPWFVFVNFFDPHAPYRPPPPYDRGLSNRDSKALTRALLTRLVSAGPDATALEAWERDAIADLLSHYDAEIAYMDHHLGRLLDGLDEAPGAAATLVVITSDHGESFGEHDYVSHGAHLYEDNVRVPLVVRHSDGRDAGTRVARPVSNLGLYGTILRATGLAVYEGVADLDAPAPIVTEVGPSDANVRVFGPFFDRRLHALYAPPYKLIKSSRGTLELYDLERDPDETRDLSADRAPLASELRSQLERLRAAHPALYDPAARADLAPDTEEGLRALGYVE